MTKASGTGPGTRQLLGPQTSGRTYRNLSEPQHRIESSLDVAVTMRDGVRLRADIHRPRTTQAVPALLAIAPYPRQAQHLGLPAGMIEAGQTDFWVPRGYAHVIANVRGTCGSEGTYWFGAEAEHHDLYDLIEWVANQPWCNGQVGMIGVSYYAIEQLRAALQHPPHLRAIFPFSAALDWYREIMWHGGMFSGRFMGMYFNALGMVSKRGGGFFRAPPFRALNWLLQRPRLHRRFERPLADQLKAFNRVLRLDYNSVPWDDIYQQVAIEHPFYDAYWQARDLTDRLSEIKIPLYLGGDWDNVAVHLGAVFTALDRLPTQVPWRAVLAPRGTLQWPWESLHIEALAWYDQWLKGRDTGVLDGPPIRYFLHGAGADGAGEWRATDIWPSPDTTWTDLFLAENGTLTPTHPPDGTRDFLCLPATVQRGRNTNPPRLPQLLSWDTPPITKTVELIGPLALTLHAASTAADTDWIVKLADVDPNGQTQDLTQGWLRASHRGLDLEKSQPYRPFHPHDRPQLLEPGRTTEFAIGLLPTAHVLRPGHRLRLLLTSRDDAYNGQFAMGRLAHDPVGLPARNSVFSRSVLHVPTTQGQFPR